MIKNPMVMSRLARTVGLIALVGIALTACRADEQDRLVRYEPGVYKGKPDTNLSEAKLEALRDRTIMQGGAVGTGNSGGGGLKGADVRAPEGLDARTLKQGGSK